jgi:hypothetical protein
MYCRDIRRHSWIAHSSALKTSIVLPISMIAVMAVGRPVEMVYAVPVAVSIWEPSMYAIMFLAFYCRWHRSITCAWDVSILIAVEMLGVIIIRV